MNPTFRSKLVLPPPAKPRPARQTSLSSSKAGQKLALFGLLGLASVASACVPISGSVGQFGPTGSPSSAQATAISESSDPSSGVGTGESQNLAAESPQHLNTPYLDAYFEHYDYDHAVTLAEYWGYNTAYEAKITKGKFILGEIAYPPAAQENPDAVSNDLEVGQDTSQTADLATADAAAEAAYLDAYFEHYDYDHAVTLAEYWGYNTAYEAKITKGKFILGEIAFPPATEGQDTFLTDDASTEAAYLDAYFEYYDYDHAVTLAEYWGYNTAYEAKITKGKFILGEIAFPPAAQENTEAVADNLEVEQDLPLSDLSILEVDVI